jgi:hypothetical protein
MNRLQTPTVQKHRAKGGRAHHYMHKQEDHSSSNNMVYDIMVNSNKKHPPKLKMQTKGLRRMELKKGVSLLASIFDQLFVKPWSRYDLQVLRNKQQSIQDILRQKRSSPSQRKQTK